MALVSRKYRFCIVPCLCVALLVVQIMTVNGAVVLNQIDQIPVNRTVSQFLVPVSILGLAQMEKMSHFASLVAPEAGLSKSDWLLDDSTPPQLTVHLSNTAIGELAANEGDAWTWLVVAVAAAVAVVAVVAVVALVATPTATPIAAAAVAACPATPTLAAATVGAASLTASAAVHTVDQVLVEQAQESPAEQAAEKVEAALEAAHTQAEIAAENAELAAEQAELTAEHAEVVAEHAGGAYFSPSKTRSVIAQQKRELMLSLELDGAVLAGM